MAELDEIFRRTIALKEEDVTIKVNGEDVKINIRLGATSEPRDWYLMIAAKPPFKPMIMSLNQFYRNTGSYDEFYNIFVNCLKKGEYEPVCNEKGDLVSLVFSV